MTHKYDAIIIGGGHNGLVNAAYLAKAGKKVLVLERRSIIGGAAVTEEFWPGFKASSLADGAGRLLPQVLRDLDLGRHGLEIINSDQTAVCLQPSGSALTLWRDPAKTARELAAFSSHDAERYPDFVRLIAKLSAVISALMTITPPDLPKPSRADVFEMTKLLRPLRGMGKKDIHDTIRILPMPMADLLDEWFESEALRGALSARAVTGITWGPREAGTAYTYLYAMAGGNNGGFVKGGLGALSNAIARAAKSWGVEIRTGAEVGHILVKAGRATGVALASGEEIVAPIVISNADARTTFTRLIDPSILDSFFVHSLKVIKYRGSCARVHLALTGLPHFNGIDDTHLKSHLVIAPSLDYVQRAYDDAKYGDLSRQPYLDALIPSLSNPSLAPPNQHVMSVTMQYAPYKFNGGWNDQAREMLGDLVVNTLACYAPDLPKLISGRKVLTPHDLESEYGLPEGSPSHSEMTLDQFLHMRPVPGYARYRAPIDGLYLCGAGTHPGGGVTGANGYNAAREVLKDIK